MYDFVATRTEYCIEVPVDQFRKLDDLESSREFYQSGAEDLGTALEKLDGVDSVEYNGHYGAAIHLRIDVDDDNEETHAKIKALIKKHLEA